MFPFRNPERSLICIYKEWLRKAFSLRLNGEFSSVCWFAVHILHYRLSREKRTEQISVLLYRTDQRASLRVDTRQTKQKLLILNYSHHHGCAQLTLTAVSPTVWCSEDVPQQGPYAPQGRRKLGKCSRFSKSILPTLIRTSEVCYSRSIGKVNSNTCSYLLATSKMNPTSDPCI